LGLNLRLSAALLAALIGAGADAADRHLGVASCASTTCHGQAKAATAGNIQANEYLIWSRFDPHAGGYALLFEERSRLMAKRLGLEAAHEAPDCLACHSDAVPRDQQGPKFQRDDGIGCEACHGGAERWLTSHYAPAATSGRDGKAQHAANIANGLVPLEKPATRAKACLGCHVGDATKRFATHRMMAAGHPRLSFELDTFTELWRTAGGRQHYLRDADYAARKLVPASIEVWSQGLVHLALQQTGIVQARYGAGGALPDFALFNCYSCHREMRLARWQDKGRDESPAPGGEPGQLRFDDSALTLLEVALATRPALATPIGRARAALQRDSQQGVSAVQRDAAAARKAVTAAGQQLAAQPLATRAARDSLAALSRAASAGAFADYAAAEQAAMASIVLGSGPGCRRATDELLASLASDAGFSARTAAARLRRAATGCGR
jgi:hypothetical protein